MKTRFWLAKSSRGERKSLSLARRDRRERPMRRKAEDSMKHLLQPVLLAAAVLSVGASLVAQLRIIEIPYDAADPLKGLPDDVYIGEVAGVATNSRGHLFV